MSEPKHNCNDCIKESVCEWAVYSEDITCKDFIDKKVLSERPQGEWIENTDENSNSNGYCSNCGYKSIPYEDVFGKPFCPNCGADMRGGGREG